MPTTIITKQLNTNISLTRDGSTKSTNGLNLNSATIINNNNLTTNNSQESSSLTSAKFLVGKGISRFSALNRSFNNVANLAIDLKRNIENVTSFNTNSGIESAPASASLEIKNKNRFNSLLTEGTKDDKDYLINSKVSSCSIDEVKPLTEFSRQMSLKVKAQLSGTLSDPLRTKKPNNVQPCDEACGSCIRCQQANISHLNMSNSPLTKKASIKKKVADISHRLHIPKFLSENQNDNGLNNNLDDDDDSAGTSGDEIDDKEFQSLVERELIVEKYEKGPEGQDVDPWENPDFELYRVTDRYGFVHKTAEEIDADKKNRERERIKKELKRESKWLKMIEEWKTRHPAKLPERIWKGVPEKLRSIVWQKMLRTEELKSAKPNLYRELLMRARLVSTDIRQIDLDINRTYRDHLAFRKRYDVKQQSLFCVLTAYAVYNTEIGYCQGMSQIAGLFLMYMDEEDAFWCLHSLMVDKRYSMHGMFAPGFPKLHRFQEHYEKVLQKYLPKLKKHFDEEGVVPSYLTKWWFGCFLDRVPFPLALRVWDVFLYYGDSILIAMAYNIMALHARKMRKLNMEKCLDYIQTDLARDFGYTFDEAMRSLERCLKKLQSERMALPHPPPPGALSELPTKPLGPVLIRSMVDIRMDIAEVHSRGSRANSIAGKSPAINRRRRDKKNPPPTTIRNQNLTKTITTTNGRNTPPSPQEKTSPDNNIGQQQQQQNLHDSVYLKSLRAPPLKPVIPDSDGFVPMSPRKKDSYIANRASVYDNVPQTTSNNDMGNAFGYGTRFNSSIRSKDRNNVKHSRENSANRIRHAQNNVTYVEVGEEQQQQPNIPPPDYDGASDPFQVKSEKLSRTVSAYQNRRNFVSNLPTTNPNLYQNRITTNSLKQRPNLQQQHQSQQHFHQQQNSSTGRYYFEPDPPGVVPQQRGPSPLISRHQIAGDYPRPKHSYI